MEKYLNFLVPVFLFALLTAAWMGVQLIAKKIGTKNHIDHDGTCCGSCEKKDICSKSEKMLGHTD